MRPTVVLPAALLACLAVLVTSAPVSADDTGTVPPTETVETVVPAPEQAPTADGVTLEQPAPIAAPSDPPAPAPEVPGVAGEQPSADTPDTPAKPKKPKKPRKPRKPATPPSPSAQKITCEDALAGKPGVVDGPCDWPTVPLPDLTKPKPEPTTPTGLTASQDVQAVEEAERKVAQLRVRVAKAEAQVEAAIEAETDAREAAKDAQWEALMASVRAEQARNVLDRYAGGMYRSGGGTTSLVMIVNSSLDDPGKALDEGAFLRRTSNEHLSEVDAAKAVLAEADDLAQQASEAQDRAAAAAEESQDARDRLQDELASAKEELEVARSAVVSAQTLIGPDGCPTQVPANTLRGSAAGRDVAQLCAQAVAMAPTPEAALAIKYAFRALGAPYACGGVGRSLPFRFDCSSLVSRAYAEGAGLNTAGDGWAPSTRDMVPWDGVRLAPWADYVAPEAALPGDLVLYDTGGAIYRHVVMLLPDGLMLHTNSCGDVAKIEDFWGFGNGHGVFLVTRRVNPEAAR